MAVNRKALKGNTVIFFFFSPRLHPASLSCLGEPFPVNTTAQLLPPAPPFFPSLSNFPLPFPPLTSPHFNLFSLPSPHLSSFFSLLLLIFLFLSLISPHLFSSPPLIFLHLSFSPSLTYPLFPPFSYFPFSTSHLSSFHFIFPSFIICFPLPSLTFLFFPHSIPSLPLTYPHILFFSLHFLFFLPLFPSPSLSFPPHSSICSIISFPFPSFLFSSIPPITLRFLPYFSLPLFSPLLPSFLSLQFFFLYPSFPSSPLLSPPLLPLFLLLPL